MKGDESEWDFDALGWQGVSYASWIVHIAGAVRVGALKILSMRLLVEAGMK